VTLPAQAARAQAKFRTRLHRFVDCGYFPQWGKPEETVRLVLETIGD
jgi:pimeloyl-ACP methyl ester carboxylesterase